MITDVIATHLQGAGIGLVKAQNLFIEYGKGDKCVVVKQTSASPLLTSTTALREVHFQVLLNGYGVVDGEELAEKIIDELEQLIGDFKHAQKLYHLFGIEIKGLPIHVKYKEYSGWSVNGIARFRQIPVA